MEELIKRLERVIQTGAPDKDGMHPISAEAVLEVIKELQTVNNSEMPNSSDAISRRAAIEALDECYCGGEDSCGEPWIYQENAVEAIQMIEPILPAEPKKGRWIEDKGQQTLMQNFIERGEVWRVCSVCGAGHMIGHKYECDKAYHETYHNFCPNCGAKMEVTT